MARGVYRTLEMEKTKIITDWERGIRRDGKPAPIPLAVAYACTAIYHRLKHLNA